MHIQYHTITTVVQFTFPCNSSTLCTTYIIEIRLSLPKWVRRDQTTASVTETVGGLV